MKDRTGEGKLIVIDGADGAGKATQSQLLSERIIKTGKRVRSLDFPQYTANHFGRLLRECLDGKRGDFLSVDARIASTLYAADRFESSAQIRDWLAAGDIVVLDRYVSSNMLHQGGKITDEKELSEFLTWLDTIEHTVFANPRPDLVLYLDVPYSFRQKMLFEDATRTALDVVEVNATYQEAAEQNARRLTARHSNWQTITCVEDDRLMSPEEIHQHVYAAVAQILR